MAEKKTSGSQPGPSQAAYAPPAEIEEKFLELERRIEAVVELVDKLRQENRILSERLARVEEIRRRALEKLEALLDKVEMLT